MIGRHFHLIRFSKDFSLHFWGLKLMDRWFDMRKLVVLTFWRLFVFKNQRNWYFCWAFFHWKLLSFVTTFEVRLILKCLIEQSFITVFVFSIIDFYRMLFPRNVNLNYCNIVRLRVLSLAIWALSTALSLGFLAFFHPPFVTIIVCILIKRRSIMLMILRIMNFWLWRRGNICWMNWMTNTIEIGGSIKIYGLFFSKWASLIIRRKIKLSLYRLHFLLRKYLL